MLVVPIPGDKIETKEGVSFSVLSYTNYRDKGPAVYVEHTVGVPSDAVYFFDIAKINGKVVEYLPGPKLLRAVGELRRRFHLPQPNDVITVRLKDQSQDLTVTGLKLHRKGELAKGLLVIAHEDGDPDAKHFVRLDHIKDLTRDIGSDLFSRDRFLAYYNDYRGSR